MNGLLIKSLNEELVPGLPKFVSHHVEQLPATSLWPPFIGLAIASLLVQPPQERNVVESTGVQM